MKLYISFLVGLNDNLEDLLSTGDGFYLHLTEDPTCQAKEVLVEMMTTALDAVYLKQLA